MKQERENFSPYLFDFIKKKIDLSSFLEDEIGCHLIWNEPDVSAKTMCPMPSHREKKSSFHINKADNGVWIYHCFGCSVKGTIIDFCMEYYGLDLVDSVLFICKKFGINKNSGLASDSLEDVKKKVNLIKKMNCEHVVSSRQCHALLRKDFAKHSKWVADAYHKMNAALEKDNEEKESLDIIMSVGFEASSKIQE